jgi:hypothetical protein
LLIAMNRLLYCQDFDHDGHVFDARLTLGRTDDVSGRQQAFDHYYPHERVCLFQPLSRFLRDRL